MNAVKFKVVIRLDKLSKSTNEVPVCLRVTKSRKSTYKTIAHVNPEYWDEKRQCVKKQHPNADDLNMQITNRKAAIEREVYLLGLTDNSVNTSTIRNKINNRTSFDLFEYADKYLTQLEERGQYATYKKTKSVIWKLRNYVQSETLPIGRINAEFIKQYENYLLNQLGNNRNTVTVNMKAIAKLLRDIYQNYDLNEADFPFKKFKFKREQTLRTFLDIEEVRKISKMRLRLKSSLYDAKDIFLFECYSGIRISDILTLKWKNVTDSEINICMRKTKKTFSIPQTDVVKAILDKKREVLNEVGKPILPDSYVFNILKVDVEKVSAQDALNAISSATAIINKQLKQIAKKAGINKALSTHVGRHTFGTLLVSKDINIMVIRDLLGHSDVRVTQIYAKVVSDKKQEAINSLNSL
ncbi:MULTISPECIES: site-specific integrase [unclassified Parabacteroides]|nr:MULTISPECIES: site-specific integrase [unclassified Parabacteroides]